MASLAQDLWQELQDNIDGAIPRTKDGILLWRDPRYVWALTALYLACVFLGPRAMKNRQPFQLHGFLVVYNLGLVALSLYMFVEIILSTQAAGYNVICQPYNDDSWKDPTAERVERVFWWYFFSKAIELLDTVLMVLRKKNEQITFLHWFHHASMLNIWWWVMMFIPGGQSWFGSCLNCLVHVVMYTYYGLSAVPSLRKYLWWKKYITKFQLIQFCITFSHSMHSILSGCPFPPWGENLLAGYMVLMLTLFSNFYIKAYRKKAAHKKADAASNGVSNGVSNGHAINGNVGKKTQ